MTMHQCFSAAAPLTTHSQKTRPLEPVWEALRQLIETWEWQGKYSSLWMVSTQTGMGIAMQNLWCVLDDFE